MSHDELEIVRWLQSRSRPNPRAMLGIGDDMAVVGIDSGSILLASDMLLDGVHFDSRVHSLELIGRKAVACNLSDCAAMAVRPRAVTLSIALSPDINTADTFRLLEAVARTAEEFGAELVGGDTNRWSGPLAIDIAVLAEPYGGIAPVTRHGARVGDRLFVTGPLGGSLRGKHLTFTPRVRAAMALASSFGSDLHAMMDITDGLSLDLWRMCQASGVGAVLDETLLMSAASADAHAASNDDGRSVLDHVLSDGEDFELLLSVAPGSSPPAVELLPIGEMTVSGSETFPMTPLPSRERDRCEGFSDGLLFLRRPDGARNPLAPRGYVH